MQLMHGWHNGASQLGNLRDVVDMMLLDHLLTILGNLEADGFRLGDQEGGWRAILGLWTLAEAALLPCCPVELKPASWLQTRFRISSAELWSIFRPQNSASRDHVWPERQSRMSSLEREAKHSSRVTSCSSSQLFLHDTLRLRHQESYKVRLAAPIHYHRQQRNFSANVAQSTQPPAPAAFARTAITTNKPTQIETAFRCKEIHAKHTMIDIR